uniref:Uncharacterized protein n=1 Tax=Anopheles stephensi TaxID=30069 RepID=A0A182YPM1_ANOST
MSLSRPLYNLLGSYLEQLFEHPLRTKALTSCVIASSANLVSTVQAGKWRGEAGGIARLYTTLVVYDLEKRVIARQIWLHDFFRFDIWM